MKTCPACSTDNNADGKFCSACGGVLVPGTEATVDHNPRKNASVSASMSASDSSAHGRFLPGTKIAGRYRIVSLAGRGAMGEVYRADDLKLGHPVALKFLPIRPALAKAKTAAEKAVALDDHSAEAHCSLGVVLFWCDWNWHGSEQHLLKALELNSNYTLARYWYGWLLTHTGRDQESIAQNRRAVEGDPLSRAAHSFLGFSFNSLKWFAEAVPPLRRALELDPNFAFSHQQLGRAYWFLGDREAALVELQRAVEVSGRLPLFLAALGQALALSGQVGQARQIQRELAERTIPTPTRPYWLYHLHAGLGENDLAFAALEQALIEREPFLAWCPVRRSHMELMSLESDPRWPVFIEKVKAAVQAGASATI